MSPAPLSVLLAEPDPLVGSLLARVLTAAGFRVTTAAAAETPDLIVIDWPGRGHTGEAVCRAVRATPGLVGVPILATTALPTGEVLDRAAAAGVTAVLARPFTAGEFVARCRALARVSRAASAPGLLAAS